VPRKAPNHIQAVFCTIQVRRAKAMNELAQMLAQIMELYEAEEGEEIGVSDAMLILARVIELQDAAHGKATTGNGHEQ
jgi:hypothetical protein